MIPIYQKGEIGLVIPLTPLGEDITGSTITIYIRKPDTTVVTKSGTIVDAITGQVSWTTVSGNTDTNGEYIQQAKYVTGGVTKYGPMETFYVDDTLG